MSLCKADGDSFEAWKKDLDDLFLAAYGMSSDDFEDYNWFDEWDNDVETADSFEEWKLLTDAGVLGC